MNTLVIDRKKYVVIEQREYDKLLKKAAAKKTSARKLSLAGGKKLANKLIDTDTLWQHLSEGMKPVSKKELVKRAKALKRNYLNK